jgi:hypothetical protein
MVAGMPNSRGAHKLPRQVLSFMSRFPHFPVRGKVGLEKKPIALRANKSTPACVTHRTVIVDGPRRNEFAKQQLDGRGEPRHTPSLFQRSL